MVRTGYKILVADAVLLFGEYLILQDLRWRSTFASSEGFSPSFSYSVLTQFFTMSGRGLTLESPPTLDWVQLIVAVLVVMNAWYLVHLVRIRRLGPSPAEATEPPQV